VKDAFANFRKLHSTGPCVTSPILSSSGQLLCDKEAKLACWKEYYSDLLSKPITELPKDLIETASSTIIDTTIDCEEPSEPEVSRAIAKLRNGKAPGICGIPGELLKHGGPAVVCWLTQIFKCIWASGHVPDDWRKGIILPFYKGKGSRQECKNYRGITLLSCRCCGSSKQDGSASLGMWHGCSSVFLLNLLTLDHHHFV